jgi:hypothetical protein
VDESCIGVCRTRLDGLFRQKDGNWIVDFSGFLDIIDNTFVDLMTVYHELRLARDMRYARILCYSDFQTVIDLILKDFTVRQLLLQIFRI